MSSHYENARHLAQQVIPKLVGATIIDALLDDSGDDGIDPAAGMRVVKNGVEFNVWIVADPEGNTGGFLDIDKYGGKA